MKMLWIGATLAVAALLCARPAAAQIGIVSVTGGRVDGVTANGVTSFKGIPFAAPPVGELRWRPPQPVKPWRGVKNATQFGNRCIQQNPFPDMHYRDPGPSEDCLTLNVWTPAKDRKSRLPVMVWIYGGGFRSGATSEPRQDGESLARKGVVVVSMNYRLGIFGLLALPGLAAESPRHAAGYYGFLDQTAALAWVRKNIAAFGGDPNNVTLFGESAGSASVSAQMASPLAAGLFQRTIGESGADFPDPGAEREPLADVEKENAAYATAAFGTADVAALRAMSADDLLAKIAAAAQAGSAGMHISDEDGYFLPEPVSRIFREGKQAHVPLLAGWNRDEPTALAVNTPKPPTVESFTQLARKTFRDRAADFLRLYPATTDEQAVRSSIDFTGDSFIAFVTWEWLEAHVATGHAPVYRYHFERPAPAGKYQPAGSGAFHSDEIEYVFGTLDSRPGAMWQPEDRQLSDLIQTYWTNFARTGNPNGGDAPQWPQYDGKDGWQVMHLDAQSQAGPDRYRARYLFLRSVPWRPLQIPPPVASSNSGKGSR